MQPAEQTKPKFSTQLCATHISIPLEKLNVSI